MKKLGLIFLAVLMIALTGCSSQETSSVKKAPSTIQRVLEKKKLVVGTSPGYPPFEMTDKSGKQIGYDMDTAKAIADALKVELEVEPFDEFSGLIPALQSGGIDMLISGMTIRGDRALAVSFANPYYATGQVLMVQKKDNATKGWQDLDQPGKKIGVSAGTTGAFLAKQLFKKAEVMDFPGFTQASLAIKQAQIDGVVYDEPGIRMYETMNPDNVKGIYDLISDENLGIAVQLNDLETVQWLNSFLQSYKNGPAEKASMEKWFKSKDWMSTVQQKS